jgi:hypothetical protein
MTTKIDSGHKALTSLARTYGQLQLADGNEAETRLKVIDEVLFSVLGWLKEDVSVEERVSEDGLTKFADYIIRTASTSLLVEAKRVGAAFVLPVRRTRMKLGGALSEGELGDAIRQARNYCRSKSIPFAAVTNGSAWIVFPAVRTDEVSFDDSEALVFRDLEDIQGRIVEFWELLSRERTLEGNLESELLGRLARDGAGFTLRQSMADAGYRLGRNALYDHLEPAVAIALSDEALLEDTAALAACYVKTTERLKYDSRLQVHVRDPVPALGHKTVRARARKNAGKITEKLETSTPKSPLRFVVVLGPVGAGKSTFLHYTRKVSAADAITGKVVWLLIDFKKATPLDNPRSFILSALLDLIDQDLDFQLGDWKESVSRAYGPKISALKRGALFLLAQRDPKAFDVAVAEQVGKDREQVEPYVETILRYAATRWPVFLVIDNVDQLEDLDFQERIFIEAQAMARRIGSNVIMSMRESTFLRHRDRPAFDAFQFDSFYIDPPSVIPVLSHRFGYARKVLSGRSVKLTTERGIHIQVPDLSTFFDLTSRSLLDGDTGFMLECLAGGDIRRGLELVREFLASGHTNADRAIGAYLTDGQYRFPRHEVFKGCVLGAYKYYGDATSLVPNLFDAKLGAIGLQLLRLQLVSMMVNRASEGNVEGIPVTEVAAALGRVGVTERDLLATVSDLQHRRILQTADGLTVSTQSSIFPTRLAAYMVKQLCREFAYVEFASIDASIYEVDVQVAMRESTVDIESTRGPAERLALRVKRLDHFLEYLRRCEERWIVETKRRDLQPQWGQALVAEVLIPAIRASAASALRSAERNYGSEPGAPVGPTPARQEARAKATNPATFRGTIVSSWPDKEYVFVREDAGTDWFAHRTDFLNEEEWSKRSRGAKCAFLHGEDSERKPRAISVRVTSAARR